MKPLEITTPSDREIVITRSFDAPRGLVWQCYTRPELLKRWYGLPDWAMTICEIDLRVGGKWRFGTKSPDGFEMISKGVYREIVEPDTLVGTEIYEADWTGVETITSLRLAESGGVTTVTTTVTYASKQARDGALATPMATGMEIGFKRLDELVAEIGST